MKICNLYTATPMEVESCHGGRGLIRMSRVLDGAKLESYCDFVDYAVIDPGGSIGIHRHEENEEIYLILEGTGRMTVNGEAFPVKTGDVVLNRRHWSHGLENDSAEKLSIYVFQVRICECP